MSDIADNSPAFFHPYPHVLVMVWEYESLLVTDLNGESMGHPGVLVDFLIAGSRGQPSAAVMSLAWVCIWTAICFMIRNTIPFAQNP